MGLAGYTEAVQIRADNMKNRVDFLTIVTAICVAAYVAVMLDHVANIDLGFSREQIRSTAVITAIVMAMLMAIDFFGKRPDKTDQPR